MVLCAAAKQTPYLSKKNAHDVTVGHKDNVHHVFFAGRETAVSVLLLSAARVWEIVTVSLQVFFQTFLTVMIANQTPTLA